MVFHMVLFKVKRGVRRPRVLKVMKLIGTLERKIPGILSYRFGPYSSPEGLNRGYTWGFCTTFKDAKSRDVYLPHPEHMKVVKEVLKILTGGVKGALAFDFEA
jgi:stress responsive alpha/beta barrel protein